MEPMFVVLVLMEVGYLFPAAFYLFMLQFFHIFLCPTKTTNLA